MSGLDRLVAELKSYWARQAQERLAAGEAWEVVAEILGHSSPVITQVVYQHLTPGMGEAAGERLTGLSATAT